MLESLRKLKDGHSISSLSLSTFSTPLKYFAAVLCGYSIDFSIYALLVSFGWSIYIGNFSGFCVGVVVNVILIRTYVFPDSRFKLSLDFGFSALALGIMFAAGMGALWIMVDLLHFNPYWSKLVTNGLTFVLNYAIRSIFFRKQ